jgi:hypothetical protein
VSSINLGLSSLVGSSSGDVVSKIRTIMEEQEKRKNGFWDFCTKNPICMTVLVICVVDEIFTTVRSFSKKKD